MIGKPDSWTFQAIVAEYRANRYPDNTSSELVYLHSECSDAYRSMRSATVSG